MNGTISEIHSRLLDRANQNDYRVVQETSGFRVRVDFNDLAADYRNLAQLVQAADAELSAVWALNRELVAALKALEAATRTGIEDRAIRAQRNGVRLTLSRQAGVDALKRVQAVIAKVEGPAPLV